MDFRTHRPQRGFGRSERSLAKIAEDLTRFLTKAQRSLTYDTLHLSSRQRETSSMWTTAPSSARPTQT